MTRDHARPVAAGGPYRSLVSSTVFVCVDPTGRNTPNTAVTVRSVIGTRMVHAILNGSQHPLDSSFLQPPAPTLPWRRVADTALDPRTTSPTRQRTTTPRRPLPDRRPLVVLLCADLTTPPTPSTPPRCCDTGDSVVSLQVDVDALAPAGVVQECPHVARPSRELTPRPLSLRQRRTAGSLD